MTTTPPVKSLSPAPYDGILHELRARLRTEGCSCVIRNGDQTRSFHERGVRDLYGLLLREPGFLRGACVADKVIGKGAAALLVLGGVRAIHAGVISQAALELLHPTGIAVVYERVVPHIVNRTKTGWCPVEDLCRDAATAEECLPRIGAFLQAQGVNLQER